MSKDLEQVANYKYALGLSNKIGRKGRYKALEKNYYVIQFGDVRFYDFLISIGLTPNKSLTLGQLDIPDEFFYDFLRGCLDGDGCINEFSHPESQYLQLRVSFYSASQIFLDWLQSMTLRDKLKGFMRESKRVNIFSFGKEDSKKLFTLLYYNGCRLYLTRKYLKAKKYLEPGW